MKQVFDCPTEEQEQQLLFEWAELYSRTIPELKLMFHIPNGGYRTKREAVSFKRCGVKAGVPDIFLPVHNKKFHGLFIELKRQHKYNVSTLQQRWINDLNEQGYYACVCHGWVEAQTAIRKYLRDEL